MILRPWSAARLAVLALACALPPSSAHASLAGLGEVKDAIPELPTALPRELPGPCAGELCGELGAPQPKTRVRGFELDLYCRLGGERGLSCTPRRVWAEEYGEGTSDQSLFTGHYFDTETNLYYAKARYFDPELGRFLSQDSYLGELTEPPSLHRYLYAWDRPTYWADPTGHAPEESLAEAAERERQRRAGLAGRGPAFESDQGGQIVSTDGPTVVRDRGPRGATLDELPPAERAMVEREIARAREERLERERHAPQTEGERRSILDAYLEKRERIKDWTERKAEGAADRLTKPAHIPEKEREERYWATQGTSAESAAHRLSDGSIAEGFNKTAVEGSGLAAREGTELGLQYAEAEVGLRTASAGLGMAFAGVRKVPNPWGRLGSPAHRAKVAEVRGQIEARGLIAEAEVPIPTVGGKKDIRYMDVVARDPVTGQIVEVHQVGRVLKSDPLVPVSRERAALRDVRRSPELRDAKRVFHEY